MYQIVNKTFNGKMYSQDNKNYNVIKNCSDCISILTEFCLYLLEVEN